MSDLPRVVAEADVGSTASLEVWRKNKKINIEVILGELPGEVVTERDNIEPKIKDKKIMSLGITIINNDSGIVVTNVEDEDSNLLIGDIISEVNREKVDNINLFEEMVDKFEKSGRSSILLKIIRDEEQLWITIRFS